MASCFQFMRVFSCYTLRVALLILVEPISCIGGYVLVDRNDIPPTSVNVALTEIVEFSLPPLVVH